MNSNGANFVSTKLNLPLFITSRQRYKKSPNKDKLKFYITSNKKLYLTDHKDKNFKQFVTDAKKSRGSSEIKIKSSERSSSAHKPWQLPPNIYNPNKNPFESRAGLGGAYLSKLHQNKSKVIPTKNPKFKLYDLPRETEKMATQCHKYKSIFLSNARERKPTTRCMISNPLTCYKDPNFPAPNFYHIKEPTKPYKKADLPNPHVFYRNSTVPLKQNSIHSPNISFIPGPGRYETRYCNICPCSGKLIYHPELKLLIDKAKRSKFRRLPYKKIKTSLYCSPDWRHVQGFGHRHIFQGEKCPRSIITANEKAKMHKNLNLYADFKYIQMINKATFNLGSLRKEPMMKLPPRITYNSMIKIIARKQLRSNKNIAFNSGAERWKDDKRPAVLTIKQLEKLKEYLPEERQLRDQPVMNIDKSEIVAKLQITPKHMMPSYVPKLRKHLFKFLPMPDAKILVSDADIYPFPEAKEGFYFHNFEAKYFFKENRVI